MLNESGLGKYYQGISTWWESLTTFKKYALVFTGFAGIFLLLLLPIPLSGSLLGSVDTLFIPALSDTFLNRIRAAVLGEFVGQSMYPADIARYGESGVGLAGIFILFRVLGFDDVYALYLIQAFMLASMALATVLLAKQYMDSLSSAVFAAFVFTTSNFVWADIDHLPIHYYFLPLLSAYFLKKAIEEKNPRHLMAAGIAGGIQFYFSVQVFIYQSLILAAIALFNLGDLWKGYSLKEKILFVACYILIPLPRFLYYLQTVLSLGVVDLWPRTKFEEFYTLQLPDLLRVLPNKLIHYPFTNISKGGWTRVAHSAFAGLAAPALAIVALKNLGKQKMELILTGFLGLLFSLGSTIDIGGRGFTSPLFYFYQLFPLANYLRVELRSYSVFLLAMSILAGIGWEKIAKSLGKASHALPSIGLILMFLFVAAENISWPLNVYETIKYPAIPDGYVQFFADKPEARILDLPSNSTTLPTYIDEIIYVLWQTKHKRNILGGVTGHYPLSRVETQQFVEQLPSPEAFRYFRDRGVTYFVWHKSPFLECHPPHSDAGCDPATGLRDEKAAEGYSWLEDSPFLRLVFENDLIRIYELR